MTRSGHTESSSTPAGRSRRSGCVVMRDVEGRQVNFLAASTREFEAMEYSNTANLNFAELERLAFQAAQRLGRALLESRLAGDPRGDPEQSYACPRCQSPLRIQEREQTRALNTVLGEVSYPRPYTVCDRCQTSCVPLDQALGIPPRGSSILHRQKVCHRAVVGRSFDDGHELLVVQAGIGVSPKHVRTIAEREGRQLVEERAETVKAFQEGRLSSRRVESASLMVVTCDGGKVQTRQPTNEGRWKEDKIAAVYTATPQASADGPPGRV